jgi:hypothetical protein
MDSTPGSNITERSWFAVGAFSPQMGPTTFPGPPEMAVSQVDLMVSKDERNKINIKNESNFSLIKNNN